MQDEYVGDVGDFAKLFLLRRLTEQLTHNSERKLAFRPGVVWYRVDRNEVDKKHATKDGTKIEYLLPQGGNGITPQEAATFKDADQDLHSLLHDVVFVKKKRDVLTLEQALQQSNYLTGCKFFSDLLSFSGKTTPYRKGEKRFEWFNCAVQAMKESDLVFLDPDDGLPSHGDSPSTKAGLKHSFFHEVSSFLHRDQSVVIIQYVARVSEEERTKRYNDRLEVMCYSDEPALFLRFLLVKHPRFIVIPCHRHSLELRRRCQQVAKCHPKLFELLG